MPTENRSANDAAAVTDAVQATLITPDTIEVHLATDEVEVADSAGFRRNPAAGPGDTDRDQASSRSHVDADG